MSSSATSAQRSVGSRRRSGAILPWTLLALGATAGTVLVAWVLVTMFERKQEARDAFVRVAEVSEVSSDPVPWGLNWPHQFDGYKRTAGDRFFGGSSALPDSVILLAPFTLNSYVPVVVDAVSKTAFASVCAPRPSPGSAVTSSTRLP